MLLLGRVCVRLKAQTHSLGTCTAEYSLRLSVVYILVLILRLDTTVFQCQSKRNSKTNGPSKTTIWTSERECFFFFYALLYIVKSEFQCSWIS